MSPSYLKRTLNLEKSSSDISILSCGGKTFKHYIEMATKLNIKTAIITDNDRNIEKNISSVYDIKEENVKVFYDANEENYTFEVSLYNTNKDFFEENIKTNNMVNGVDEFMLSNKTDAALRTLEELEINTNVKFTIPEYIKEAIQWISE